MLAEMLRAARFLDVTTAAYHADPCERPSLSSSVACEIVSRSALHAWQVHPKLGGLRREATAATNDGTLIHALLLGEGDDQIAVLDVENFRTNAAKEKRDAALAAGKTIVKAADYDAAKDVAELLRKRLAGRGIVFDGRSEAKIEWAEETDEGPVLCRGMLDHHKVRFGAIPSATIYDLKTIRSCAERMVQSHIAEYGYDIQEAAYRSAVGAVAPETIGRIDCVFLFVEIEPPYDIRPVRLDGIARDTGETKWRHACRTWARCLKTDTWPGYTDGITEIGLPPWALVA